MPDDTKDFDVDKELDEDIMATEAKE